MGKVAGAQNFDGRNWHEQHIAKRTRAALDEQDRAFAERHAGDPLAELACYLRRCAEHWGRSPAPCEIVGGSYIAERFGSWSDALRAAHLNPAYSHPHNRSNGRYQREKETPNRAVPGGAGRQTGGTGKEKSGTPAHQCRTGGGQAGGRALRSRADRGRSLNGKQFR